MEILAFSCLWPKSFYVQCWFTQKCGSIQLIIVWICEMLNCTFSFRSGFIIRAHGILIWEFRCKSHITFSDWSDWKKLFTQKNGNFDYCAGIFMSVTKIIQLHTFFLTFFCLQKTLLHLISHIWTFHDNWAAFVFLLNWKCTGHKIHVL